MTTIECPSCEQPVEFDLTVDNELRCGACLIHVELAPDPAPPVLVAAAA